MAHIPAEVIEEVRSHFDIVEVISSYIDLKKAGRNYVGFCPFHSEKTPSFTVSPEKQIFYCFGCQNGGNLFTFVMQMEDCSFPDAVRLLAERSGISIERVPPGSGKKEEDRTLEILLKMHSLAQEYFAIQLWKSFQGKKALQYFYKRGLTEQSIRDFQLGYTGDNWQGLVAELQKRGMNLDLAVKGGLAGKRTAGRYYDYFRHRLIFPIWDNRGRIVAFGGRALDQGEPKYLNSPESPLFHKGRTLYGLHLAMPQIRRGREALLVEGYMDVILLHQHNIRETVAPLGTSLTEKQIALLRGRLDRIILVFDADSGGEIAALRGTDLLKKEGCGVLVAQLPEGRDPADFVKEYGEKVFREEILQKARPLNDYRLFIIKKQYDLQKEEDRVNYWKDARKILLDIPETLEREEYLKKIASEINVSLEVLRGDLEKIIRSFFSPKNRGEKSIQEPQGNSVTLKELVEKELLRYICNYPVYLKYLREQGISDDIFSEGPYRRIAGYLFTLDQQGKEIEMAGLLSYFSDQEMHKLIIKMALPAPRDEEHKVEKIIKECARKMKALCWAEERERLIKALRNEDNKSQIHVILQRIHELKKREEELFRSGEGEDFDG